MGKLFNLDSPLMRVLGKIADVMWLNLLTTICCIPIVTAGAAFSALHYSCLKLVRGEESYVTKDFFKSFKENLKQGIVLTFIVIAFAGFMALDYYCLLQMQDVGAWYKTVLLAGIAIVAIFGICTITFLFPIQARFSNTIKGTIRNAFMMSFLVLPKTLLMVVINIIPFAIVYIAGYVTAFHSLEALAILFWFSAPAYLCALLYNKTFKRFEPEPEKVTDDFSWSVEVEEAVEEKEE